MALLILSAGLVAWLQRRTIARDFVDRELSRRGVDARYEITQLSPWRQRLTNVVIGDPRRPDLTADWLEVRTGLAPWQVEVLAVRAGQVRLRGRLVNGVLSLGAIDRLLPTRSGRPPALPALVVDIADARMTLDSPAGQVQLAIAGKGRLRDGFRGTLRAASPRLALAGCAFGQSSAQLSVRVSNGHPNLAGPISFPEATCGNTRVRGAQLWAQVQLGEALSRWRGTARMRAASVEKPGLRLESPRGDASFDGDAENTGGRLALQTGPFDFTGSRGRTAKLAGTYGLGEVMRFTGSVQLGSAALPASLRRDLQQAGTRLNAGPLQPLIVALFKSMDTAASGFDASADLSLRYGGNKGALAVTSAGIRANSGGRADFDGTAQLDFGGGSAPARAAGTLVMRGGGLPEASLRFSQDGGVIRGTGVIRPYAVGATRLAASDLAFRLRGSSGEASAKIDLSGTLPQGRVDRLQVPLNAVWKSDSLRVNAQCVDAPFQRLTIGGFLLSRHTLALCPRGGAMVRLERGRVGGGFVWQRPRLFGTLGGNPLRFAAEQMHVDLGQQRFGLSGAAVRLGPSGETRLDVATLSGTLSDGPGGMFSGLAGQMESVPLLFSGGSGDWRLSGGMLSLTGAMQVRDAAASARFNPLMAQDAAVLVRGANVQAKATLNTPKGGTEVADVRIVHDLNTGEGSAKIAIEALRFTTQGLQPQDLSPLAFGMVAQVEGTVFGQGRIAWTRAGVTSTGSLGTDRVDLAAAVGPVRGLATTLHFTDLLGMRTAAGELASLAEINPGVPVTDGRLRFQILDSQRIQIEGGRWPFAGGELVLEPTLLDFSESRERRLTFRVIGADAALFLKEMNFDNISATGTFDGTLPMVFDAQGGRIDAGNLQARGGGSIAYVGEVSRHDLGFWGNMAFQALRSLNYRSLSLAMNGPLAGDMVTEIRFTGVSQGKGAKSNFLVRRLARLPFVFNIRISAPFQQLLSSVQSWYDPSRLIERNLPALLEAQEGAVQQPESQSVRPKERK